MPGFSDTEQRQRHLEELTAMLLDEAKRRGASAAEAGIGCDIGLSVNVRMGEVETIEQTRNNHLGITVYFGDRKGSASTTDLGKQAICDCVEKACNIARYTAEDPFSGLADKERMATTLPDLDLYHPWDITTQQAIEAAKRCEQAALQSDARIVNSDGASLESYCAVQVYGNSHGFIGSYPSSRHNLYCSVLGREGDTMQRDSWYTTHRMPDELEEFTEVGRQAAKRTLARLGARKLPTMKVPVVFQADVAVGLLQSFIGAIRGSTLYRKASFLLDHLEKPVFPAFIHIHENPLLLCGSNSAAFDNEGVATQPRDIVCDGVLKSYVLDSYSGRKLGLPTTGNSGGVRNLRIDPGAQNLNALLREMGSGVLVTELMGQGVNLVTGDYSRGAFGFWVEHGEIQYPVEGLTAAGNLKQMFQQLLAVGCDLETRGSIHTGSWLIDEMTVAGEGSS